MSEKFILSSSSKDSHGTNFNKEQLQRGVTIINGDAKLRYLVNHRREYPLLGFIDHAELVEKEGLYLLVAERILFSQQDAVSWDRNLVAERPEHPVRIKQRPATDEDFVITLDPNNFGKLQEYINTKELLKNELGNDLQFRTDTRKGHLPDPRVVISLLPIWVLAKPFIKKIGNKIADDIGEAAYEVSKKQLIALAKKVKKLIKVTREHALPKDKPLSLIFELNGEPYIELHAKTDKADLVAKGLSLNQLAKMKMRVEELNAQVTIAEAHFDLTEKGSWSFTYLITTEGIQIGRKTVFKKRDKLFERIKLSPQYGHSVGADITYESQIIDFQTNPLA